jgi:RNA polymerase sigma-70 factor (ECF subfamily)
MARATRETAEEGQAPVRPPAGADRKPAPADREDPPPDAPLKAEVTAELNGAQAPSSNGPDEESDGENPDAASDPGLPAADAVLAVDEGRVPARHRASPEEREADRLLVERARGGDHGAFRQLYDKYHKRAFSVAYGVLKNRHDALDVVQEGFVKVHRHLGNFEGTSSFYTWLYRIVMNLAIDSLRRRKTSRPVEYDDAIRRDSDGGGGDDTILARMLDSNPRKAAIRRELVAKIDAALAELPDYHREVILLREIDGMSYEEMAEVLDVPKGTIMSRLFHARKKMQAALADYVDGDMDIEE